MPSRIGLVLLNILAPGLGLLRTGFVRRAFTIYAASVSFFALLVAVLWMAPELGAPAYAALIVAVLCAELGNLLLAMRATWLTSRFVAEVRSPPSRWYSIVIAALAAFTVSWALTGMKQTLYRNFYVPSEGMEPTLIKNEHFVASMRPPVILRRGDLVLVRAPLGALYVKRLVGLPKDRVALSHGIVVVNGDNARLQAVGFRRISYPAVPQTKAQVYRENLVGETGDHLIQDLGLTAEDDMPEKVIPAGHVFVLGDNRDDSADSRVPREDGGLEMVPVADVIGRPLFLYWPWSRFGASLASRRAR